MSTEDAAAARLTGCGAAYFVALASVAALRRQSRHRQSSPSTGIGSRAVSSAHQQVPDNPHENAVPQPEQTI
ncbi:hypothetical protein GCM10007857_37620 [Bradyrhizobium iriomotense]|uniref:Uncharacterized protein n=1 Tax=Bradyrhizobium iriomotense TaxID=441950 RepID=A0ABQ6B375_9BRAD|nr:hypothetical protein GCM10007857_37620 [Bradyrhizobium iriomotense]